MTGQVDRRRLQYPLIAAGHGTHLPLLGLTFILPTGCDGPSLRSPGQPEPASWLLRSGRFGACHGGPRPVDSSAEPVTLANLSNRLTEGSL